MRIRSNGITHEYRIEGPADAPVVTFSHSIMTDLSMWDAQAERLKDRYRVLRYDTRGHGASDTPPAPYSFSDLVADVVGLWDALGIKRSHFVGLSLGGMIGLGLAAHHPERLLKAVICDARADATPEFRAPWPDRMRLAKDKGMDALVEPTIDRWFPPGSVPRGTPIVDKVRAMIRTTRPEGFCGCAEALLGLDYIGALPGIKTPVLYLVGDGDGPLPAAMRDMSERTPGAAYTVIERAGHIANLDQPDAVTKAIEGFLARG